MKFWEAVKQLIVEIAEALKAIIEGTTK